MNKKHLLYFLFILVLGACDSIKDVKAPTSFIANIPQKTVLTLASVFPNGKSFVAKEISTGQLWEIKFESNGKN